MKFPTIYAVLIGAGLLAAPVAASAAGPRLAFVTNEYNFGRVVAGTIVKYTYTATNTGDQTLVISNVVPGCHCTTAGDWTHHIEPGQTGKIPIQFDSGNFRGDVTKNIKVISNDKLASIQTLTLRGTIWKLIDVNPQSAFFSVKPDATSISTSVLHLINQTDELVALSNPTSSNASFKAELKIIKLGKEFELTVSALPPFAPGNTTGSISIKTSLTNLPVINISAMAMAQPVVILAPPYITLPPQIDGWTTNFVTITANRNKALALSDPQAPDKSVSVEIKEITPGRVFQLAAIFPPGYHTIPGKLAQVTIKSNNTERPVIIVPITQDTRLPVTSPSPSLTHPKP